MRFFQGTKANTAGMNVQALRNPQLVRKFVETGDERCPLACIWLRSGDDSPLPVDECKLASPAAWRVSPEARRRRALPRCNKVSLQLHPTT